jgi:ABC-type Fe3+-hydroxamate transport system substrate-binding protein
VAFVTARIVSLVPSITETLSAWNRTPVGCTRFCERDDLRHVGGTKDPDVERILALEPDLVVMDAEENRREDYEQLVALGLDVHVTHVRALEDVDPAMRELSDRVDGAWETLHLGAPSPLRSRAFVPIWRRPWMALGRPTYGSSLLAHLGVATEFAGLGPYPTITLEDAALRHPDLVLAPSEPYPFTRRQLSELETVGPAVFLDGKDLFWWGTRTSGALERLAEVLARS